MLGVVITLSPLFAIATFAQQAPLIPRQALFGNPDKAAAQISPNGKHISYLSSVKGVLNIWVGSASNLNTAKPMTADAKRGIRNYFWAFDNTNILYLQDAGGDENEHLYRLNITTGKIVDLTPIKGVKAMPVQVSYRFPHEILLGLNDRNPQYHDIYRLDLRTGNKSLIYKNDKYAGIIADDDYKLRFAMSFGFDFVGRLFKLVPGQKDELVASIKSEDLLTTQPLGFDGSGKFLYLLDSRDKDKSSLVRMDAQSGQLETLAENDRADIGGIMFHPTLKTVQGYSVNVEKNEWYLLDKAVMDDFEALKRVAEGEINVSSRTLDDSKWIVDIVTDNAPIKVYLYDRKTKKAKFLYVNRKALEGVKLAKMRPVNIKARDGLNLVSYLTLPSHITQKPSKPLPTVLLVHGGPYARDDWGYNGLHQWLSNRGYAVLSVNYRGSTGFGKGFSNAANHEWAGKMHDDLIDATDWLIKAGYTDETKIAIMGGSYGGYATLVGLTFTPDKFTCGVDIVGPSNLVTLLRNVPAYWMPMLPMLKDRIGDPETTEGRKLLEERSPLFKADKIQRPLLIGQGKNDPRVKQQESDQIVKAMKQKNLPVSYILYPNEGHGFQQPENSISFWAVVEAFLSTHIGGRREPIGEALKGSTLQALEGMDGIIGLREAIAKRK